MATSPNFNWPEPDNTDLVKNGALAIRTAVDAIDTSLVDLKGGTTGQVLAKASNTDMDFSWVTDATGIPATIFDAKGDIIAATAADTASRLAVGTNGQVLTADSAEATGLKWATPAGGTPSFVGVKCYKSSAQSIPNATWTALTFDSESFDTDGFHSTSTNTSRITIPSGKAGKYLVQWQAVWAANGTGSRNTRLLKNAGGTHQAYGIWSMPLTGAGDLTVHTNTAIVDLIVGDYLELNIGQGSGGSLDAVAGEAFGCTFSVTYLGA